MAIPLLPPAFQLVVTDRAVNAFERAVRLAPRGLDDGTVYWTDRGDLFCLAVALEPEADRERTLEAVYVATVAVGDALGALLPPAMPVAFAWPGSLIVDGAVAGRVRAAVGNPSAVTPSWLVVGLELALGVMVEEPGTMPTRTSLGEVGATGITSTSLAESVTRHLLYWMRRWLEDGMGPVRGAWNRLAFHRGQEAIVEIEGQRYAGRIEGLDAGGAFHIGDHRLTLGDALPALA